MENQKYLTEENYERGKKKIKITALLILMFGLLIGVSLIATGIMKQKKVNSHYSEENKTMLSQQLETERQNLINKKVELEAKIEPVETQVKKLEREKTDVFMNGGFSDRYYEIEDEIGELKKSITTDKNLISAIDKVVYEGSNWCNFNEVKNNTSISKYCSLKLQLDDFTDFYKEFDSFDSIPFYVIGGFIILITCIMAGSIYMFSKRREIITFEVQQVMPIAKEGIETITPTIGEASASIAKEMAPVYGDIAKEISKGIKEGLKDEEK